MPVISSTSSVTPTPSEQVVCSIGGGPFDNISVYVQGGAGGAGRPSLGAAPLTYRLYATVGGFQTLIAQSNVLGSASSGFGASSIVSWQDLGAGAGSSQDVDAGGTAYTLTVQDTEVGTRQPVTATIAGVNTFDTAPSSNFGALLTVAPAAESFLTAFAGYAQLIDVAVDQTVLPGISVTVYASCGVGSVVSIVKSVIMSGRDSGIASVFRGLKLPVASSYLVSITNESGAPVTTTLTATTYSTVATATGGSVILAGDVIGPSSANTVNALQGVIITGGASPGQVLTATGILAASWLPPSGGSAITQITGDVTAGPGPGVVTATVVAINGASVPLAGAIGNVLQVVGINSLSYGPVALDGGSNFVSGILPIINQAPQNMFGDVTGTTATSSVVKLHGAAVPAAGALVTGNGLYVTGPSSLSYSALNLAGGPNYVIGTLPSGNQSPQTLGGDLSGTTALATVNAINGVVVSGVAVAGDVLTAISGVSAHWVATSTNDITQITGDVTAGPGPGSVVGTVVRINGASLPAAGALTIGNGLYVTGASSLAYSPLNLAGGINFVTGLLPTVNQSPQVLGGDLSGTTAVATVAAIQGVVITGVAAAGNVLTATTAVAAHWAPPAGTSAITQITGDVTAGPGPGSVVGTVVRINGASLPAAGALTIGNGLYVTGASSLAYSPLNLAGGINFVTGLLPAVNQSPQALGGDLSGTTAAATVGAIQGVVITGAAAVGNVLTATSAIAAHWAAPAGTTAITQLTGDVTAGPGPGSVVATVVAINGATVPAAGALVVGNGLYVTGAATLAYSALNLAGGASYVTGLLPAANQSPQVLGGDLSGTTAVATVAAIQGVVITGAAVVGNVLTSTGALSAHWAAPAGSGFIAGGDLSGSATSQTVEAIQGVVITGAAAVGQVLTATSAVAAHWAAPAGSGFVAGGDLTGSATSQTVNAIQGVVITGVAAAGNVLTATSAIAAHWAAPANANAITQLTGDVTAGPGPGSVAATVVRINGATVPVAGALVIGNTLRVSGASALTYSALNLAGGVNFVTGLLPAANQSPQTLSGDITGTTAASVVSAIQGVVISGAAAVGQVLTATSSGAAHWAANSGATAITQLTGDVLAGPGPGSVPATVIRINGATVSAAGALTTGNGLYVTGPSALTYSALNLAGGASYVTGLLPAANQSPQVLGGDLSGTTAVATVAAIQGVVITGAAAAGQVLTATSSIAAHWALPPGTAAITQLTGDVIAGPGPGSVAATVLRINGATVSAAGALVTGNGLYVTGPSALTYSALNLGGGASYVTGILPAANQAPQVLGGDLTGTTAAATVAAIQGVVISGTAAAGDVLTATSAAAAHWAPNSGATAITQLTGDVLAGPGPGSVPATVVRINGATVSAAGALITGNGLYVTGPSALTYSALNLAGGANYVTGILPAANQAPQTMAGDVTGTTAASVVARINGATVPAAGALVTGNVLQVIGPSTLSYAAVNLAGGASFVTGKLPLANLTNGGAGQLLLTNPGGTAPVWVTMSGGATITAAGVVTLNVTLANIPAGTTTGQVLTTQAGPVTAWSSTLLLTTQAEFTTAVKFDNVAQPAIPVGGPIVFGSGGALKAVGTSGTVTTMAPADLEGFMSTSGKGHCPCCGTDFAHEWENPKYGRLTVCMACLTEEIGKRPWIVRTHKKAA